MAALDVVGGQYQNLLSLSPLYKDGVINPPAKNLLRLNVLLQDAVVQPSNDMMSHTGSYGTYAGTGGEFIRVGAYRSLSTVGWGTFKDDISTFSDASAVPKDVVDKRGTEWQEIQEGEKSNYLGQSIENHMIYGTNGPASDTIIINGTSTTPSAAPEKYTGLAPRFRTPDDEDSGYDATNPDPSTAAQRGVFNAGGAGTDTTSIWFIRWGRQACSVITPKADPQYGLRIEDLGEQMAWLVDSTSHEPAKYRRCYMKEYQWDHGLSIYPGSMGGAHVARLRNIETSLAYDNSALKSLIFRIIREYFLDDTAGTDGTGALMMYMPPRLRTIFDVLFQAQTNVQFTTENPWMMSPDNWAGKVFMRTCRAININETAVAAV